MPKLIAWRPFLSCSTRKVPPTEPGSIEELKRHRLEFREVLLARIFRVDYWRRVGSTESSRELQRDFLTSLAEF